MDDDPDQTFAYPFRADIFHITQNGDRWFL